ncbi:hypothetical protein FA15DRAFT_657043 [Coprinopsis marcescibilis]|uniref:Uncharacterized protein n=1 Tax=Coprinopsis marcescibilis TaxID=230819 RepID=A0A5C3KRF5_COPMA|nr:hypothetical protein FA15DRAFT_657043 [Coprinopsis marcescibilis]
MTLIATLFIASIASTSVLAAPYGHFAHGTHSAGRHHSVSVARDFDDLDARFSFKKALRAVGKIAKTAVKVAPAAALLLRDEEGNMYIRELGEDDHYDLRDLTEDLEYVDIRDVISAFESPSLEARSPQPFKLRNIIKKVKNVASKVGKVAGTVSNVASTLGLRDDVDLVGRVVNENQPDHDDFKGRHGTARRRNEGTIDRDDRHSHIAGREFALEELD